MTFVDRETNLVITCEVWEYEQLRKKFLTNETKTITCDKLIIKGKREINNLGDTWKTIG